MTAPANKVPALDSVLPSRRRQRARSAAALERSKAAGKRSAMLDAARNAGKKEARAEAKAGTPSTLPEPATERSAGSGSGSPSDVGESAAGVILAAFFWGWVALPFLTGGVDGVKNMLRAKFLNKAPDGTYLP